MRGANAMSSDREDDQNRYSDEARAARRRGFAMTAPASPPALTGTVLPPESGGITGYRLPEPEPPRRKRWGGGLDYVRHHRSLQGIADISQQVARIARLEIDRQKALNDLELEQARGALVPLKVQKEYLELHEQVQAVHVRLANQVRTDDRAAVDRVHDAVLADADARILRARKQKEEDDAALAALQAREKLEAQQSKMRAVAQREEDGRRAFRTPEFREAYQQELHRDDIAADAEDEEVFILAKVGGDEGRLSAEDRRRLLTIRQAKQRAFRAHSEHAAGVRLPGNGRAS